MHLLYLCSNTPFFIMVLNFKEFGQGDPIIILHGLFGTLDNWQTIAKQLAEHFTVYIIDQRNHGKSPHDSAMDYSIMAEDLKDFMESNWIYKAHILGHSMGGKVAMKFAMDYPDMVDKLIVVDIGPKAYAGGHQVIFDALLGVDLEKIENRKQVSEAIESKIQDVGVRQFLLKNLSRKKEGGYRWKMNLVAIHEAYQKILDPIDGDSFEGKSYFIKGEKSDYLQENDLNEIHQLFSNAKMFTIKDAGHWIHADKPKELLELLFGTIF